MTDPGAGPPEDISIVSAVYNHEATVADTLDSILMQDTRLRYRVYCMNDASTDRSGEILADYQARHPDRITVFTSRENQGSGKKSFLHHRPPVRGRFWCLLAGDDYWTAPDKLERQVAMLEANPAAIGCSAETVMRNEMSGEESVLRPEITRWNLMNLILQRPAIYVHPSSILWRNAFLKDGFFLPRSYIELEVAGDTALHHKMLENGHEMVSIPEVMSCYRVTGRGVWTRMTRAEQDTVNIDLARLLRKTLPPRYTLARRLWRRKLTRPLAKLIAAPVGG